MIYRVDFPDMFFILRAADEEGARLAGVRAIKEEVSSEFGEPTYRITPTSVTHIESRGPQGVIAKGYLSEEDVP